MQSKSKRIIVGALLGSFLAYTTIVYTLGTREDKGLRYITPLAVEGKHLFQKYNCIACHQIYGLGGYLGPDLTNVIARYKENTAYINALLRGGSQRMPNFHLNNEEVNSIIEYLNYIDKTGISPVVKFTINYDGTVSQENNVK